MNVSDFGAGSESVPKLQMIVKMLESIYDVTIDWNQGDEALREAYVSYTSLRAMGLYEATNKPSQDFTRIVLITEALRIYLYEIAPKRRKNIRRK
jgi:hypothetical protein